MKILIKPTSTHFEQLDAIACLQSHNHQVGILQAPLHLECVRSGPDVVVSSEIDLNEEIQSARTKYGFKLLVVNSRQITVFGKTSKISVEIPRLANTFKYRNTIANPSLSSDIYIHCSSPEQFELAQHLSRLDKKIKITAPSPLHSTNFVGIASVDEIMTLAKSSKLTLSDNDIFIDSLIFSGIPALNLKEYFALSNDFDPISILQEQSNIQPISILLNKLNETISNIS